MKSGEWRVKSGEWGVKSGEWGVKSGELLDRHAKHLVGLGAVLQAGLDPAPRDGADHSREKQGTWMAYREHGKVPVPLGVSLRVSW